MFKVNSRATITRCEIRSKLTIKTPERLQWRRSGFFIANFEHLFFFNTNMIICVIIYLHFTSLKI